MSRSVAKVKDLDYEIQLSKGMQEAEIVFSLCSRGTWVSDSIIKVHGFSQGPLPVKLTLPFDARPGEDAFGIVMRLEEGGSLENHLCKAGAQYDIKEKIRILAGIAKGLAALHSANVVHADLKPANVLLSGHSPPEVRLSDFGLSTFRETTVSSNSLERTDSKRDTLKYCAPEMHDMEDGSGKVARASRKTDVYAFSITAWEVLAGQQLGAEGRVMMEVLKGERPSLNSLPIGTPPHIKQMIVDC